MYIYILLHHQLPWSIEECLFRPALLILESEKKYFLIEKRRNFVNIFSFILGLYRFSFWKIVKNAKKIFVLILDGNSEHVAYAQRKKGFFLG